MVGTNILAKFANENVWEEINVSSCLLLNMKIRNIIALVATAVALPQFSQAQDLMAREAVTDYKLSSSKTAKIIEQFQKKEKALVANSIYGNVWDNTGVNIYKGMAKPENLVIDLRDFSMPIKSRLVTSNFGYRKRFRRNHYGIDVKGYTGDTIYAAFSGKVRVKKYNAGGFGYYLVLRHSNGLETVYGHLSKQLVNESQEVVSGQPIGLCGNTGHSFGSHLHFETRVLGEPINPAKMFNFAEQDVTGDTYTYRATENNTMPVATPINSYAQAPGMSPYDNANEAGEEEVASVSNGSSSKSPKSKSRSAGIKNHKVKSGENPSVIARKYHITVAELYKMNRGINPNRLRPGQTLVVRK